MENVLSILTAKMQQAFVDAGYADVTCNVIYSNRPDLCEFQCDSALKNAKVYRCAPIKIANEVVAKLEQGDWGTAEAVMPGFINLKLSPSFLQSQLEAMRTSEAFGVNKVGAGQTVVIDYGGPNVAKPLHIGHLRSAIIGESLKRLHKYLGYNTIGDIHLGDWGLQMGLIIAELEEQQPGLPYFDPDFTGEYPSEPPFTISELEKIYPAASAKKKVDEAFADKAHTATYELQHGRRGYRALWQHIMDVSLADIRRNYRRLDVSFDSWLGESDADPYIPAMVEDFKAKGLAVESQGALVIPVAMEDDREEINPCILVKSDGSSIYATTDLATMVQRVQDWNPDKFLYITDNRQGNHFLQVFRAARLGGIIKPETQLVHLPFGTMNGKDGKPFKTRAGGVLRLETLLDDMTDFVRPKVQENQIVDAADVEETTAKIALAALKYGDLSNAPTKNYIFDMDKFAAFEGNTGPYILYAIVRIKSILTRYGAWEHLPIQAPANAHARNLMLTITKFEGALSAALKDSAPSQICAFIYELAGAVNKFYKETPILKEENQEIKAGHIALIGLAKNILEQSIDILGFSAPEKM